MEFQPDAVEIEKRSVPGGARWTLYTVIALIAAAGFWSWWAKVDRIVVAQGNLITLESPVVIQPIAAAMIREVRVKFGDVVRRGDVLATLDPTFSAAELAKLETQEVSLSAAIARLTAERDGVEFSVTGQADAKTWELEARVFLDRRREFAAKMATFQAEREKLNVQQTNNANEIVSLQSRVNIYQQYYNKILELREKKSESLLQLWEAEVTKLDAERSLEKAESEREQFVRDLDVNSKQEEEFVTQWRSKISSDLLAAHRERDDVLEELAKARRMNELAEIIVPPDLPSEEYVVLEVADRSPGSAPKPGESLFKLVALNSTLEADIEIPARDIGLVKLDNDARVKIDAFPYQKHGTLDGKLVTISEGAFQKGEPPAAVAMFKARLRLGSTDKLKDMPPQYRLMPGMTVTAEIRVGTRRVIEYFLYPILRHLDSSIREP